MEDTLQTSRQDFFVCYLWIENIAKLIIGILRMSPFDTCIWMIGSASVLLFLLFFHALYYIFGCNIHSYNKSRNCEPCVSANILLFANFLVVISGSIVFLIEQKQLHIVIIGFVGCDLIIWWIVFLIISIINIRFKCNKENNV
jgi:hypothetical protein